jgi:hypothetical protein
MDTIGRGSIHGIKILSNLFHPKGPVKSERMGNGTFLPVWCNDKNITHLLESLGQHDYAFRMDTIIIGHQEHQSFSHLWNKRRRVK